MCVGKRRTLRATIVTIFSHMTRDVSVFVKCGNCFFLNYCRSGEEQRLKSPTPGGGPDEYHRAVESILIYLKNTSGI